MQRCLWDMLLGTQKDIMKLNKLSMIYSEEEETYEFYKNPLF